MNPAWITFIVVPMQPYNMLFNIFYGGKGPQRQKPYVALVPQDSVLMQERKARRSWSGLPAWLSAVGPWGAQQGQARAGRPSLESQMPQQGSEAQATPAWPAEPLPTPCPMSCPKSPPPRRCPHGPGLRKGVFRFLAEPSFLFFFFKWTRSGCCCWKGTWGPDMGQQIPAMLMGSEAEGGGAGRLAALGTRTRRGPPLPDTLIGPLQTPAGPPPPP